MPKVLIVEDQPEIRRLWAINLAARSYDTIEAADGRECLTILERKKPDVVLLDLDMPVLLGWDVLESLKEEPSVARVPVIVLTGWADSESQDRARELGAVDVLIKPFGVDELLLAIERVLKGDGH